MLEGYLPQRLGADEIAAEVAKIVAELGATGPGDMGKVMGGGQGAARRQGRHGRWCRPPSSRRWRK